MDYFRIWCGVLVDENDLLAREGVGGIAHGRVNTAARQARISFEGVFRG